MEMLETAESTPQAFDGRKESSIAHAGDATASPVILHSCGQVERVLQKKNDSRPEPGYTDLALQVNLSFSRPKASFDESLGLRKSSIQRSICNPATI
jgi:hypothetical protein